MGDIGRIKNGIVYLSSFTSLILTYLNRNLNGFNIIHISFKIDITVEPL